MFDPTTHTPAALPEGHPPVLAVIVDTEEEFDWTRPLSRDNRSVTAVAGVEPAHEAVFDLMGLRPDYVIDYPIAADPSAMAMFRRLEEDGRASIGAHLHPWVNPPDTEAVTPANSYPGNLPRALEAEKLRVLTDTIAQGLGRRPTLYKAGRYGGRPQYGRPAGIRGLRDRRKRGAACFLRRRWRAGLPAPWPRTLLVRKQ